MAESTPGIFERAREKILRPQEVKFHNGMRMVASTRSTEPSIRLYRNKDVVEDLRTYVPAETIIKVDPKGRWAADIEGPLSKPILTMGKINGVYAIADFLHEGGHLQDPASADIALTAERRYAQQFFKENPSNKSPERFRALREMNEAKLQSERSAWAFAIRIVRQLDRKHGIGIVDRMGGVDGVLKYVNGYLRMYEQQTITELEYLGFEVYSKTQMEELLLAKMSQ